MFSTSLKVCAVVLCAALAVPASFAASSMPMNPFPTGKVAAAVPMNPFPTGKVAVAVPMNPFPTGKVAA